MSEKVRLAIQTSALPSVVLEDGGTGLSRGEVNGPVLRRGARVYIRDLFGPRVSSSVGTLSILSYSAILTTCEVFKGTSAESHRLRARPGSPVKLPARGVLRYLSAVSRSGWTSVAQTAPHQA